ncbi:MAG: hypothetical protein LBT62_05090 [Deltaproteobacteria bacterium]|nr:hypothetical protein [Deltaproteobacteria bacterium]
MTFCPNYRSRLERLKALRHKVHLPTNYLPSIHLPSLRAGEVAVNEAKAFSKFKLGLGLGLGLGLDLMDKSRLIVNDLNPFVCRKPDSGCL